MARRSDHSQEQIKEMILNAAEAIIILDGAEALTVRKVAQEIGYTVGSIYMVYANMQDLLMHIKAHTLELLAAHLQENSGGGSPEQQVISLAESYLNFAGSNFNRWRLIFEPGLLDDDSLPDWYKQKIEEVFAPVEALFRQIKPNLADEQTRLAARSFWCGVHGVCVLSLNGSLSRAGVENTEAAVRLLADNFILGWKQSK